MTRVEERRGFEILLEEPPSAKSLWAALIKTGDCILSDKASDSVHVCLSCSREGALADARAFIDKVASDRPHVVAGEDGWTKETTTVSVTYYVVVPFDRNAEGDLTAGEAKESPSAASAERQARLAAQSHAGAVAFSRAGDPAIGDFQDAAVLAQFGDVDLNALSVWRRANFPQPAADALRGQLTALNRAGVNIMSAKANSRERGLIPDCKRP
jgi:hypothetical protein